MTDQSLNPEGEAPNAGTFIILNCTDSDQHFLKNTEENVKRLQGLQGTGPYLGVMWILLETVHGTNLHIRAESIKNWSVSNPSSRAAFYDFRELLKDEDIDEVAPFTGIDDLDLDEGDEWKRSR